MCNASNQELQGLVERTIVVNEGDAFRFSQSSDNEEVPFDDEINTNLSHVEYSNLDTHISVHDLRVSDNIISGISHTINISGDSNGHSDNEDPKIILNELRAKNSERLIIAHININSVEHKFESIVSLVKNKVDIIMISETKIDESFPLSQFQIEG